MSLGPIDFIALEFPGNRFKGEILPELFDLVEREVIRIYDLVIVTRDADGTVLVRELQELDPGEMSIVDPFKAEVSQMITELDIQAIAEKLDDNCTAALMLIENLWAKKTKDAMAAANGRLVMFERIPHEVVEEALAEVAALRRGLSNHGRSIMMRRGRGAPVLRRTVAVAATTAVVAGTAGAVHHHQNQKYAQQNAAAQQQYAQQDAAAQSQLDAAQQQAYEQGLADAQAQQAALPAPAAALAPDMTTQLQQMAQLHSAGVLTDEEFAAAKQKILAG